MSDSELLTPAEIRELTAYSRCAQQAAWLQFRRIPHRVDGRRVILSRAHLRAWLEGRTVVISSGVNLAGVK